MPNSFRVAELDRLADVKTQSLVRHQPWRQFAGMQADVHSRIKFPQPINHVHVQVEIAHGDMPILRHYQVETHYPRIGLRHFEAGQYLRKHLLRAQPTEDLIQIPHRHSASRLSIRLTAMQVLPHAGFELIQISLSGGDYLFESASQHVFANVIQALVPVKVAAQMQIAAESYGLTLVGREHGLQIREPIVCCLRGRLGQHVPNVIAGGAIELEESIEKMVVT